jgi:phospholipase/carboxylesterase
MLLLHGYTGDERVMWALDSVIPADFLVASLRGIHPTPLGGFQWIRSSSGKAADFTEYDEGVRAIAAVYREIGQEFEISSPVFVMGFSQGAATAFAVASQGGIPVRGVIALAGYLPSGKLNTGEWDVFWGHGSRDEMVPVERARNDVNRLSGAGIEVQYCEADVGHKLGAECTRGLGTWLARRPAEVSKGNDG